MLATTILCVAMLPAPGPEGLSFREVKLDGVALTLAEEARSRGLQCEDGPATGQVVLRSAEGDVTPLLCNAASKALFTDVRIRGRKTQVVGRRHEGFPFIEVVAFQVADTDGVLRTPEYFCDVCTISARHDQNCPCCQGPMELRMKPGG